MRKELSRISWSTVALGAGLASPFHASAMDWWIKAGPVVRGGMSLDATGSSYSQGLGQHAVSSALGDPPSIGAPGAYANRVYDNGYVGMAPSTGNPAAINPNTTWNWGYNPSSTAGQYNTAAGTLSFSKQGVPGYTSIGNSSFAKDDELLGGGLDISVGTTLHQSDKWAFDLGLGFQGIWGASAKLNGSTYAERIDRQDATDRYNVAGIVSTAFANLGHRGTYGGPFDVTATAPYTVIPNLPVARDRQIVDLGWTAQNNVSLNADLALYKLSLNPSVSFAASKRLSLRATPSISMNVIDVSAERSETFYQTQGGARTALNQWKDSAGDTAVAFGLGATVGAEYNFGKGWSLGLSGGYEWVTQKASLAIGPNRVSVDASGWTAGLVFGKSF